jgi:hypothetical protein
MRRMPACNASGTFQATDATIVAADLVCRPLVSSLMSAEVEQDSPAEIMPFVGRCKVQHTPARSSVPGSAAYRMPGTFRADMVMLGANSMTSCEPWSTGT